MVAESESAYIKRKTDDRAITLDVRKLKSQIP